MEKIKKFFGVYKDDPELQIANNKGELEVPWVAKVYEEDVRYCDWRRGFYLQADSESASMTVRLNRSGLTFFYSLDGLVFLPMEYDLNIYVQPGKKLFIYGDNPLGINPSNYSTYLFYVSTTFKAGGNLLALLGTTNISKTNYCFSYMFYNQSIVECCDLPNQTANYAYNYMFYGSSLRKLPKFHTKNVATYAYNYTFYNCYNIQEIPDLKFGTVESYGCYYMFRGTNATSIGLISAETVKYYGFAYMFYYNHATNIRGVDLETLEDYACTHMFERNSSYSSESYIEKIDIKYIGYYSCYYMFSYCTFVTIPNLNFKSIGYDGCYYMFNYCNKLIETAKLEVGAMQSDYCCYYMYYYCNSLKKINEITVYGNTTSSSFYGYVCGNNKIETIEDITIYGNVGSSSFNYFINGDKSYLFSCGNITVKGNVYSLGFQYFLPGASIKLVLNITVDGYIQSNSFYGAFFECNSLVDIGQIVVKGRCYPHAFENCFSLTSVKEIVNIDLKEVCDYGLYAMFAGCESLEQVHMFNILSLYDYQGSGNHLAGLFSGCSKLTNVPEDLLSNLERVYPYCFGGMFFNCTSLNVQIEIPENTAPYYCQRMFSGCESLQTPPALSGLILSEGCYSEMFSGCTSLETTPELNATNLYPYCYEGMFAGCTVLSESCMLPALNLAESCYERMFANSGIQILPNLPASLMEYRCYLSMFSNCQNIQNSVILGSTNLADYCYAEMFDNSSINTPPNLPATDLTEGCYSRMFYGCQFEEFGTLPATELAYGCYASMFENSSLTTCPALPASELKERCYERMFAGTNITSSPALLAKLLVEDSYKEMFAGCNNLNHVEAMFVNHNVAYLENWLLDVAPTGTITKSNSWNVIGPSGIPVGWTETSVGDWLTAYQLVIAPTTGSLLKSQTEIEFNFAVSIKYISSDGSYFVDPQLIYDSKTVTVTVNDSGVDRTITGTFNMYGLDIPYTINQSAMDASISVDLNGQWVSDTISSSSNKESGYNYYMSNSNYHVQSSYSQFCVTWSGVTSITFKIRSYAESSYDYLVVGGLDGSMFTSQPSSGSSGITTSTSSNQKTTFSDLTINCDAGEHHIWFCYRKDGSVDSNDDRAFVGVPKLSSIDFDADFQSLVEDTLISGHYILDDDGGVYTRPQNDRIVTQNVIPLQLGNNLFNLSITDPSANGLCMICYAYSSTGSFLGYVGNGGYGNTGGGGNWYKTYTRQQIIEKYPSAATIRLTFKYPDNRTLTPDTVKSLISFD